MLPQLALSCCCCPTSLERSPRRQKRRSGRRRRTFRQLGTSAAQSESAKGRHRLATRPGFFQPRGQLRQHVGPAFAGLPTTIPGKRNGNRRLYKPKSTIPSQASLLAVIRVRDALEGLQPAQDCAGLRRHALRDPHQRCRKIARPVQRGCSASGLVGHLAANEHAKLCKPCSAVTPRRHAADGAPKDLGGCSEVERSLSRVGVPRSQQKHDPRHKAICLPHAHFE